MKKNITDNKIEYKKYFIGIIIFLVIVIIILIYLVLENSNKKIKSTITHDNSGAFLLTSPILDCEINNNLENTNIFYKDVTNKIEDLRAKYLLSDAAFYFRDLNNGEWIGINEKDVFSPASLLKVPVFISLLHEAQSNPSILDKKVIVTESDFIKDVRPNIVSTDLLMVGKEYSLFEVARSMIDKSDNTGINIILRNTKENSFNEVFKSIGVTLTSKDNDFEIRVKDYAAFFRVLFNASYLNREMSEKALSILLLSDYNDGIVAGVPSNIKVAHKFGERNIAGEEGKIQLHDCGIVYYPNKPYLFCAMTKGNNFNNQSKFIKELSSFIYDKVDKGNDF